MEPRADLVDKTRYSVLTVCKLWRDLLLRTPEFWANALGRLLCFWHNDEIGEHDAHIKLHLELSRTQPLNLRLFRLPRPAFQMFAAQAYRIASVEVSVTLKQVAWLNRLLGVGMPLLCKLVISHIEDDSFTIPLIAISTSKLPQLRSLEVREYSLFDINGTFSRLRQLSLDSSYSGGYPVTINAFLDLLSLCAALVSLTLVELNLRTPGLHGDGHRVVSLPHLRECSIQDRRWTYASTVLSWILVPSTCSVCLPCAGANFQVLLPADTSSFPPISAADSVEYCFMQSATIAATLKTYANGSPLLHMGVYRGKTEAFPRITMELADLFAPYSRNIHALSIDSSLSRPFCADKKTRPALRYLLHRLRHITTLRLPGHDAVDVLSALGKPPPPKKIVCPRLEHLCIGWTDKPSMTDLAGPDAFASFCDALVGVLESRGTKGLRLRTLSISVHRSPRGYGAEVWDEAISVQEAWLRNRLEGLVSHDITVDCAVAEETPAVVTVRSDSED